MSDEKNELFADIEEEQHERHLWSARIAILAVAVIYFFYGLFTWLALGDKVPLNALPLISAMIVIGLIFGFFYFYAKTKPYVSVLISLQIYIVSLILEAFMTPERMASGLIIKGIILVALINGFNSAQIYENRNKEKD